MPIKNVDYDNDDTYCETADDTDAYDVADAEVASNTGDNDGDAVDGDAADGDDDKLAMLPLCVAMMACLSNCR